MASMLPDGVQSFSTEGEERFYRFLAQVAKPDRTNIVWYLPDINGKEPDFILYSQGVGLIVFEVKDWRLDQIRDSNPFQFTIVKNGKPDPRKNPLKQAREYASNLMEKIKSDGTLVARDPSHFGNPRIPINWGVVFPNINKLEYTDMGLHTVIPVEKIFFWDDLNPNSDICCKRHGCDFQRVLAERFPPRFAFTPGAGDLNHLRQLIFPMVRIQLPDRGAAAVHPELSRRLKLLDHHQESLARKYEGGHRIITGASGSGKTILLVHKAAWLRQYNPDIRRILIVCYNITLVNYIKRLLSDKRVPMGDDGVTVYHFYELCARILGESFSYEKEDPDFYDMITREVLSRTPSAVQGFDAILVDEGQDFTKEMFQVVMGLLNPATNNLTIVLDENQNIYRKKAVWKQLGINARGRVHALKAVYRNTVEIAGFAGRFIGKKPAPSTEKSHVQLPLFSDTLKKSGPDPELIHLESLDAVAAHVAEKTVAITRAEGHPLSEVAVLYTSRQPYEGHRRTLPEMIRDALEKQGILSQWVSEDISSKKNYDITTDRVTISTIHSAKGLDYSVVFLLGMDLDPESYKGWSLEQIHRLVYVGITRARYRLMIPYVNRTSIIDKLMGSMGKTDAS